MSNDSATFAVFDDPVKQARSAVHLTWQSVLSPRDSIGPNELGTFGSGIVHNK